MKKTLAKCNEDSYLFADLSRVKNCVARFQKIAACDAKVYVGVTANSFKERFRNHTKSIKNERHGNETELSKYIWKLKRAKRSYDIKWSIVKRVPSCKAGSRKCNLCLEEKLSIMKGNKANNLLNKRSELFSLCKHITNSHVT